MKPDIKLFESKKVRAVWNEQEDDWYFSIVDVVEVLTDSPRPRKYWNALKTKLQAEGSELSQKLGQLKLKSEDGKMRLTDVANTQQILRLVQSVPSKKAEPFKLWLAKVGAERIEETFNPELSIDLAIENYRRLGCSENWINQRIKSIEVRKALTDEWDKSGVQQGKEYADLSDLMSQTWSGMTTCEYKNFKGLKKENLRDNMTNTELVLNMLAEVAATDIMMTRKTFILITVLILHISIMAQEKQQKILFEQQNINVLLEQDKDTKTFLTSVSIQTPANYYPEMDDKEFQKVEFMMCYYYTSETETSRSIYSSIAYFVPNGANYKIHESSYLYNWFWRETKKHYFQEMSFQVEPPKIVYIGNSDNDKLTAVKVWKYVTKHWEK